MAITTLPPICTEHLPFSLVLGLKQGHFIHQATISGPVGIQQAYYACINNRCCRSRVFFAMTKFTSAQDVNK